MSKETFDHVVNANVNKADKAKEQALIIEAFRVFQEEEIPNEVNAYKWVGREVLLKVFKFTPEVEGTELDLDDEGSTLSQQHTRYFSVAKVLAAGPEARYYDDGVNPTVEGETDPNKIQVGDIVKLKDVETLSIETSKYKEWNNHPHRKGNAKPTGKEPNRFTSNIFQTWGNACFVLNPFNISEFDKGDDEGIYKQFDSKIENKITNVDMLIS